LPDITAMLRSSTLSALLLLAVGLAAQDTPSNPADSASKPSQLGLGEMQTISSKDVQVKGDYDVAPAPPACTELAGEARLNCVSSEVLAAIRKGMDQDAQAAGPHSHPVLISFVINQFGDMKDIRVEHTGSSDLPKKVIVALYALPKFVPAKKNGASVGTTLNITYPYAALFTKE
jgi:hypothetical protein